jgi:hypothetical protein
MSRLKKKKNPVQKIKDGNPFIKSTRQMRTQVDTTQQKKTKANNQQKLSEHPMQRGLMA